MSAGIDYGRGQTNINLETGIRYGCISQHTVGQAWYDDAEPDYGPATCPKCGSDSLVQEFDATDCDDWEHGPGCRDYACESCQYVFDSDEAFGDEPQGWSYSGDGYELVDCLDSDILVISAPFYTLAEFCSPCVPGAGNLDGHDPDGVKAYCLGHDWFEGGKAPYPVYSVETGQLVSAE